MTRKIYSMPMLISIQENPGQYKYCDADIRLVAECSHNSNLGSICTVDLCPRLSKQEKKL